MAILLTHATVATMIGGYGLIPAAALAILDDKIAWVGPMADIPAPYADLPRRYCNDRLITPGLIDCHSHVVFAGNRAAEFEMRLNGASYADVARAGGGILSTVTATRSATEGELLAQSLPRVDQMIATGATTIEVKSGYGLTIEAELTILRAARRIAGLRPVRVITTHLAAHAIPPEFAGRADDYITEVALPSLHAAHAEGLIDAVDGFCEGIAFSPSQIERVSTGYPVDMNKELKAHGISNILSGCTGGLQNYVCYCNSVTYYKCKGGGVLSGLLLALISSIIEQCFII